MQFGTENTASSLKTTTQSSLLQNTNLLLNTNLPIPSQQPSSPASSTTSNKLSKSPSQNINNSLKRNQTKVKEEKTLSKDPIYKPNNSDEDEIDNDETTSYEPIAKKKCGRKRKPTETNSKKSSNYKSKRHHHYRHQQTSDEGSNSNDVDTLKQCLGPACCEVARNGSKYCSGL